MARRRNRNRRKRVDGFILPPPFVVLVLLAALLALVYVWLGECQKDLGRDLKALENELAVLRKEYVNEECRWTMLKSPRNLERELARHGLRMAFPRRGQIVHLYESLDDVHEWVARNADPARHARLDGSVRQ